MKVGSDIHVPQRISSFISLVPSRTVIGLNLSSTLVYEQTPAQLMTSPSATAN